MANFASPPNDPVGRRIGHYLTNAVIVGLVRFALMFPYRARLSFVGWIVERVVGPLAGYRKRARQNLAMIWPDLSDHRRNEIADRCLNNVGRSFIENYSAREFPDRMAKNSPTGAGVAALEEAAANGQAVILVTGHYGNYEATRACLVARGYDIGGLYRGGQLVLLFDQHVFGAPQLDFLGEPANTALSAAELALRYDALLIPFYGIRQADGLSFDAVLEAPIPHTDALAMTQSLNDSLAARIKADPEQWFWVHRRWRINDN